MLAVLIFVLLLVTTFFLLLFYKSQVPLLLVLPTELQELLYIILLTVATLCEVRGEGVCAGGSGEMKGQGGWREVREREGVCVGGGGVR